MSETDYMLSIPDRKRQTRVCHINMLEAYPVREKHEVKASEQTARLTVSSVMLAGELTSSPSIVGADEDGIVLRNAPQQCARLANSGILRDLSSCLINLTSDQASDIVKLISDLIVCLMMFPDKQMFCSMTLM